MAARALTGSEEQWDRVAQIVYDRRQALGLTAAEVVERAGRGLSLGVLSQVENCRKTSYTIRTVSTLERVLGWMPRSIERILEGGEPEEVWVPGQDVANLKDFPNWREFEHVSPGEVYEQLVARVEKEAAALREELAAEREERERLAGRVDELAQRRRRRKANPEPDALPDWINAGDEDEVEMWGLRNLSEETRTVLIHELRRRKAHVDRAVEPPDLN